MGVWGEVERKRKGQFALERACNPSPSFWLTPPGGRGRRVEREQQAFLGLFMWGCLRVSGPIHSLRVIQCHWS